MDGHARKIAVDPLYKLGTPHQLYEQLKLPSDMRAQIGGIAMLASNIEYWSEQNLWLLERHDPQNARHTLDGQPNSKIREALKQAGKKQPPGLLYDMIVGWCDVAELAFPIRNTICHSVTIAFESGSASFIKDPRWQGEIRKKPPAIFDADAHTLELMEYVFVSLFKGSGWINRECRGIHKSDQTAQVELAQRNFRSCKSVCWELKDLAAAMNHEKY